MKTFLAVIFAGATFAAGASAAEPDFKFTFDPAPARPGFESVSPDAAFGGEHRFGFDLGTKPGGNRPFFFSAALPEGDYDVAITFGDAQSATTNTVKAESRRLMIERVVTKPGEFAMRTITVNIRTPQIPSGARVGLKERERGVLHWDDKLTLEFNGTSPGLAALEISPATNAITVFLLGDSTVTDQPKEPWNSWGQMLTRFFQPGVAVANHAESGESLKGSLGARRVAKVLASIKPGDYVFVQFGHNDQKDKATNAVEVYKTNLTKLVADVRARKATPVLVTSMERKGGVRGNTLAEYPETVRQVAKEQGTALIDLQVMSRAFYVALGVDMDKAFQDGTHHNNYGSYEIAKCVAEGIRQNKLPLAKLLADDFAGFDPAKPDAVAAFDVPESPLRSEKKPDGN